MKRNFTSVLILFKILFLFSITFFGQNPTVTNYDLEPNKNLFFNGDTVFIPTITNKSFVYKTFVIGNTQLVSEIKNAPQSPHTLEGDYYYVNESSSLSKYNRHTNELIWKTSYGPSGWAAQDAPIILSENLVGVGQDDYIVICNKETGELLVNKKGSDFENNLSLSGDNLVIGSKFNGQTFALNLKTQEIVWKIDVGSSAGFGSLTVDNRVILPSWDAKFYCVNQLTGKIQWCLDLNELKNGCGSGFEECPVLIDNKLYAVHRDEGLFIIDFLTGKVENNLSGLGVVNDNLVFYENKYLLFCSYDQFYIYSIAENKIIHTVQLPFKMLSQVTLYNDFAFITATLSYDGMPHKKGVLSIDLTELIK